MNRILLLIDDYSELMFVQIILKKLGFDVDTLQNYHTLPDRFLSFRPNLLILTEDSKKSPTESVLNLARSQIADLKFILLRTRTNGVEVLSPEIRRINTPIQPIELIKATAQSCNIPTEGLIEKFKKFRGQLNLSADQEWALDFTDSPAEVLKARGEPGATKTEEYEKYLAKNKEPVKATFSQADVQKNLKSDRAKIVSESSIDEERKKFATQLFKKSNSS